jgi:hypothetical protein
VEELLAEIEGRSAMLFGTIPGAVTVNARNYNDGGHEGFSDVSMGRQWSSSKVKKQLIEVSSNPVGALLSVDGRPQPNCHSTPCNVELSEGNHKFTFVLDRYFDLDTVVNVTGYTYSLSVKMIANFGMLVIDPKFPDKLGNADGLAVQIGDEAGVLENTLSPGRYRVSLEHACYEDVQFTATIARGKTVRYDNALIPKNGHVSISALQGVSPQRIPVYVNGDWAGTTPFDEDVSVCAQITVGDERIPFPYAIRSHQDIEWTYEMPEEEVASDDEDSSDDDDSEAEDYSYKSIYSSSSSSSYRYSYRSSSSSSYVARNDEETSSSSSGGLVRFIIQGLAGVGIESLSEDKVEDEEVLMFFDRMNSGCSYWDDYYGRCTGYSDTASIDGLYGFLDLFIGLEFSHFLTVGAGAGIGSYVLSSSNDEDLDKDLPPSSFAPNIFLEISMGTEYTFGARYMYIFDSRWPSSRVSVFFEWLNVFGFELGMANTEGLGSNICGSIYFRAPTRGNITEFLKDTKKKN